MSGCTPPLPLFLHGLDSNKFTFFTLVNSYGYRTVVLALVSVSHQKFVSLVSYSLTPWSRVLLEKLTGFAASQGIPRIYGTRKFITVLASATSPCEYYLTWVFTGRIVSTSPNPQAGGPPLVGCPRLLIQFIRSYHPYRGLR
jgi:hypothetical protein